MDVVKEEQRASVAGEDARDRVSWRQMQALLKGAAESRR